MLYSENQMIDLIRKAGVIQMKDDLLGISRNTLSSTLGMGGITPDPAQPKGCYSGQDRAMQDARLQARANFNGCHAGAAAVMTDEEKRRRKACPNKPLKLSGSCLTGYEGSLCKQIEPVSVKWIESEVEPEWFGATDVKNDNGGSYVGVKFKPMGIDTDKFRKECLEDEE